MNRDNYRQKMSVSQQLMSHPVARDIEQALTILFSRRLNMFSNERVERVKKNWVIKESEVRKSERGSGRERWGREREKESGKEGEKGDGRENRRQRGKDRQRKKEKRE